MVGAVIGSYQIVRKLGSGGMGVVYLGQHTLIGRRAAIKVLLPALSERQDVVRRFFNEARAVTSISDPGIVQVFDFGYHTDGSAFIVMEFLDGETLDRRLARLGRLPVLSALRLCQQLAISLEAAHAQRIIHRDLKPENIFLVRNGASASGERPKILDFGIAKLSDDHPGKSATHTGVLMGTPRYMSPEQCRGLGEIDHRSDIYALGCVMFHLLTGRPPFTSIGVGDVIAAHIREPAPSPSSLVPEIPSAIDALILRCLAKPPADRFASMLELATALGRLAAQLAVDSGSPALPEAAGELPASALPPVPDAQPPMAVVPTAPTTLGDSSGQIARSAVRSRSIGRWIAAFLVLSAVGAGLAIVCTPSRRTGRAAATNRNIAPPAPAEVRGSTTAFDAATVATADPAAPTSKTDPPEIEIDEPVPPSDASPPPPAPAEVGTPEPAKQLAPAAPPSTQPKSAPPARPGRPASPTARPPPVPESMQKRCDKHRFDAIRRQAPSQATIDTLFRDLNVCRKAGAITNDEYQRYQSALVQKM